LAIFGDDFLKISSISEVFMLEPFVEFTWTDPYTLLPYVDLLQHEYGLALQIMFF